MDFRMSIWGHSSLLPVAPGFQLCSGWLSSRARVRLGPVRSVQHCVLDAQRCPGPWKPLGKYLLVDRMNEQLKSMTVLNSADVTE